MGLFGKKVKFEEDPVAEGQARATEETAAAGGASIAPAHATAAATAVAPAPSATAPGPRVAYGIDDAIRLMRSLPADRNTQLVVRVVKHTLESMHVHVADIISDAERKEAATQAQIAKFKTDMAELEKEIQVRRDEIGRLEADLAETTSIKHRLRLADGNQASKVVVGG